MSNSEFAERIARIRAEQDQRRGATIAASPPASRRTELAVNALYPLSLVGAVLLGMLAMALGRYAQFHLATGTIASEDADFELAVGMALGVGVSFVLSQALRLTSAQHRGLQAIGVFLAVGLFHNLAHWMPGPMATAFSPAYVQTLAQSRPRDTFAFRGVYFPFLDTSSSVAQAEETPPQAEAAEPAVQADPAPTEAASTCPVVTSKPLIRSVGASGKGSGAKFVSAPDAPADDPCP